MNIILLVMSHIRLLLFISFVSVFGSCDNGDDAEEKCEAKYVDSWDNGTNPSEFFAVFNSENKIVEMYTATSDGYRVEHTYTYDDLGRITEIVSGDNAKRFYYFGKTRVVESVDGTGLITYLEKRFYDDAERMIKREEYFYSPSQNELKLERYSVYTYTGENATLEEVYEWSGETSEFEIRFSIKYTYDDKKLPFAASLFPDFAPHPPRVNNLTSVITKDLSSGAEHSVNYTYQYNAFGYPTKKFEGQNLTQNFYYKCEPRTAP